MKAEKPIDQLTYEEALAELEQIVAALEANQGALEESLVLFERGQKLSAHCVALLEQAELKVRTLTGEDEER